MYVIDMLSRLYTAHRMVDHYQGQSLTFFWFSPSNELCQSHVFHCGSPALALQKPVMHVVDFPILRLDDRRAIGVCVIGGGVQPFTDITELLGLIIPSVSNGVVRLPSDERVPEIFLLLKSNSSLA